MKDYQYLLLCELPDNMRSIYCLLPEDITLSEKCDVPYRRLRPHVNLKKPFRSSEEDAHKILEYVKKKSQGNGELSLVVRNIQFCSDEDSHEESFYRSHGYMAVMVDGLTHYYDTNIKGLEDVFPNLVSCCNNNRNHYSPHITLARNVKKEDKKFVAGVLSKYIIFGQKFSVSRISLVRKNDKKNSRWETFRSFDL